MSDTSGEALTAEGWAARYLDEYNNLRPVPANGAVPGERVHFNSASKLVETFGDRIDRLGSPDGEFFTILGGTFDQRAYLPDAASATLHSYRITGFLPEDWVIELGTNAPAFGRGGGARYVLFLGANGQKMNTFELSDLGVIDEVHA